MAEDDKKREEEKDDDREEEEDEASGGSADDGDDREDDDDGDEEEEDEADAAPAADAKPAARAAAPADHDDEEPAPPPKAAPKAAPAKPVAAPATASSPRKRAPLPPEPPPIAVGKTVSIFVLVMGGLSAGFYLLGAETGGDRTAPRWKSGQTVEVNITLVATDRNELACASDVEIAGRRCEFVAKNKPAEKVAEDKLLKPYTTTDNVQFLGAGLWNQPDLEVKKLPADRFNVKCKYTVEGEIKKPAIRWATRGGFADKDNVWYSGVLKDCALAP